MKHRRITPEKVTDLQANEFVIVGTNKDGNHTGGFAAYCKEKFGLQDGISRGFSGQCYCIDTMSGIDIIKEQIPAFIKAVKYQPEKMFIVTEIGTGIAGHKHEDIAPLFKDVVQIFNVALPLNFLHHLPVLGFKGFEKDLKCKSFQFKEGEKFTHEGDVKACNRGFHFCENPLDIFKYYRPGKGNVFHQVTATGKKDAHNDDSKLACQSIEIGAKITLPFIIKTGIKFIFERVKADRGDSSTSASSGNSSTSASSGNSSTSASSGYYSTSASSGYSSTSASSGNYSTSASSGNYSTSASSGDSSTSASSGNYSTSASSGYYSTSASSGDSSTSASSGNYSTSASSGYYSTSASSGDSSTSASSGDYSTSASSGDSSTSASSGNSSTSASSGDSSTSASSGDYSKAIVTGENSIAVANGVDSKCKGTKGNWIVLSEYKDGNLIDVQSFKIDGKNIKEDTFYTLKGGKPVEAN